LLILWWQRETALTITTALAAGTGILPGFIRSQTAGNLTVAQYESGTLPHADPDAGNVFGTFIIDGNPLHFDDFEVISYISFDEAREITGVPLLVPTHLENGELPVYSNLTLTDTGFIIDTWYQNAQLVTDTNGSPLMSLNDGYSGFFILAQTYVGDVEVIFNVTPNFSEVTINGHNAVWVGGNNGGLYWVQDGIFVQLLPCDLDREYVLRIAESLRPLW
jgi:hypothetical protein